MNTFQTSITLAKDIVTILATVTATIIAYAGLQTWKKQLRANAEYDLARRALIAVYKVRDAVNNCRIFIDPREHIEEAKKQHNLQIAKVDDSTSSLAVELLEAEAVWGDEKNFHEKFENLYKAASYMKSSIWNYYSDKTPENVKDNYFFQIFYSPPQGKGDIDILLETSVYEIEDLLRPKLKLRRGRKRKKWAKQGERLY
jgi:hypothetical protein